MIDPLDSPDDAATPLSPDERGDLLPSYITSRAELNAAEQENILEAETWAFQRARDILSELVLDELHKRMFSRVWRWAGRRRTSDKNIGVDRAKISEELRKLLDDCHYWIEKDTYPSDDIAARFHHRLVWIHPYPNGNGRHSRLASDLLLARMQRPRFTWGRESLIDVSETRQRYIAALRAADNHDIKPLLEFVRS